MSYANMWVTWGEVSPAPEPFAWVAPRRRRYVGRDVLPRR